MQISKPKHPDPLYLIFEEHLYNFEDSDADRKTFILNIVNDYLIHLKKLNISVPKTLEHAIVEELSEQVNTMLVKKIYGCHSVKEFQKKLDPTVKKRVRAKYKKLVQKKAG